MDSEFAGTLNERVTIEHWIEARDSAAADAGFWQLASSAHASVIPDGRGPAVAADARRAGRRWRVSMRAADHVGLLSRLIWRERILAVLAVEVDPRLPDRLMLVCDERRS